MLCYFLSTLWLIGLKYCSLIWVNQRCFPIQKWREWFWLIAFHSCHGYQIFNNALWTPMSVSGWWNFIIRLLQQIITTRDSASIQFCKPNINVHLNVFLKNCLTFVSTQRNSSPNIDVWTLWSLIQKLFEILRQLSEKEDQKWEHRCDKHARVCRHESLSQQVTDFKETIFRQCCKYDKCLPY